MVEFGTGKDDTVLAKTWSFLGGLLVRGGHLEEAEEAYDAAVAVNEAAVRLARAGAPLDLARDLTNRAVLLAKRPAAGQDAEALLRRALQLLTYKTDAPAPLARVSDPVLAAQARAARSPAVRRATADALAALGGALMRRGAHADAEAYLRDAVARTADAPTGAHYGNLACCLLELEKPDAVDYAQKQLELDVVAYGENHALVAADEDALATALDLFDRVDEANAHGKKALDLATALLGADHATTRAYAESWGAEEGG